MKPLSRGYIFGYTLDTDNASKPHGSFVFSTKKRTTESVLILSFFLKKPNGLDELSAPQAQNRKKVVVSQRRYERVYKRIDDANVPFCEKGGARQRADVFLQRKTEQSELCSDVAPRVGLEPTTTRLTAAGSTD